MGSFGVLDECCRSVWAALGYEEWGFVFVRSKLVGMQYSSSTMTHGGVSEVESKKRHCFNSGNVITKTSHGH